MSPKKRPASRTGGIWLLRPAEGEEACLTDRAGVAWRLSPSPDGFTIEAPGQTWALRGEDDGQTLVLRDASGGERARASALLGAGEPLPCDVLLPDGRLFRLVPRLDGGPVVHLRSWEAPGAYLVARHASGGWHIEPTPAGEEIAGDADVLALALAGCLLWAERAGGAA